MIYPFVIVDLYWQKNLNGYLAWLLPVSITLIHINAFIPAGSFRVLSIDDSYAVILLTIAAADPVHNTDDVFKDYNLSERETEVALLLMQEGLSNEEKGNRLFITERTVKFHVSNIFTKFGVRGRAEFIVKVKK